MSSNILRRLWQRIRSPTYFVGRDLEDNRYFEYPNPSGSYGRTKRVVRYRRGFDMWTYIAGERRLPVQWTSWLTHTRTHPPTLEELQADLERQRRVRLNAALIEARDRAATPIAEPQVKGTNPRQPGLQHGSNVYEGATTDEPNGSLTQASVESPALHTASKASPLAQIPSSQSSSDETQAWVPKSRRRADP